MIALAEEGLADVRLPDKPGFVRSIVREPVGVVFVVAPWNYPYLTSVNAIVPALLAGNAVLLKHSAQTPLCAERLADAARIAGLPEGVFQYLHLSHDATQAVIASPDAAAVPEPAAWAMMVGGFALAGTALRRRATRATASPVR